MIRTFMIEFEYYGKTEFANVVEYKYSPSVFYVSTVNKDYKAPSRKLILHQVENRIETTQHSQPADESFVNAVAEKIQEYISVH